MHFSTIFLRNTSKSPYNSLTFLRRMGGGPRTFPGGLNKWQWKRMHEKKAREKEKRLLEQEKQLYQARIRSEIRAKLASADNLVPGHEKPDQNQPNYGPLTPQDHIKALADRFMKEGAEDLWNENDGPLVGPVNKPGKSQITGEPIDLQKLIAGRSGSSVGPKIEKREFSMTVSGNVARRRRFSTYNCQGGSLSGAFRNEYLRTANNEFNLVAFHSRGILMGVGNTLNLNCYYSTVVASTMSKRVNFVRNGKSLGTDSGPETKARFDSGGRAKWPRFRRGKMDSSEDDDSDDYDNDVELDGSKKFFNSSAALGKYDGKTKKRVPLKFLGDEDDLSQHVKAIRKEFCQRRGMQESEKDGEESILSTKRFDECGVSSLTVQALAEAGYVQMTRVQEATLSACLEGKDAFVKARAATGKSVAFLLPAIETVLKASSSHKKAPQVPPIYVLILCPTRELASQISAEANVLLKYHDGIGVQTLTGGTRFKVDQRRLESEPCQILVATPGRLLDHIENKSGISVRLMGLHMLILDEADCLLNLGFRKDMEKIVDCLPRERQSLLCTSTIPKEVRRISQLVLKRENAYIDTVGLGCLETHEKVKQFYLVAPHYQHLQIVHHILKSHISEVLEYKAIVFCATAMMTSLMCSLLQEMKLNVREIHSKKSPLYCTRISNEFKESKRLILITSDVSARGINYPDVTLVIQVGIPSDRGQYIHRLGRTGRQGKEGEGILLLAPWEQYFLDDIKDLPLEKCPSPLLDPNAKTKIEESMQRIDTTVKEAAYHAWLGYYNSIRAIGRDKTTLAELANQFSASIGLQKPPAVYRKTALKMGLKGIPGILIRK